MAYPGGRDLDTASTGEAQPEGEVEILAIAEKRLVEPAGVMKCVGGVQRGGGAGGEDLALRRQG